MSTRRYVYLHALVTLVVLAASWIPARHSQATPEQVTCRACLVVSDTGEVLWARNPDAPVAIASTTKLATALVVRDRARVSEEVTVSAAAAATSGGKLSLEAGEVLTVRELLAGMLLNSSNDAAVALAEHVGGTETAFVGAMNELADALGTADTHFTTSHGLDDQGHHSTASDLVILTRAVLEDRLLAKLVATPRAEISSSTRTIALENTNVLLESYRGAIGVKTGFTGDAGNVLVSAARRHGRTIIAVALGSVDHFADSRALLDHGFARLAREVLVRGSSPLGVLFNDSSATQVVVGSTLRGIVAPSGITTTVALDDVVAPLAAGTSVGRILVTTGSGSSRGVPAVVATSLSETPERSWPTDTLMWILDVVSEVVPGEG